MCAKCSAKGRPTAPAPTKIAWHSASRGQSISGSEDSIGARRAPLQSCQHVLRFLSLALFAPEDVFIAVTPKYLTSQLTAALMPPARFRTL